MSHASETLLIEKKSKFISSVTPVSDEQEAIVFLNSIRSKYPDANHHVYAYIIDENNIYRYSDDGEPQGTAGMPVLDTLRKSGIVDVCVVVTRYFGGTLLGTGGLVHAYGASATQGLLESKVVTRSRCDIVKVTCDYTLIGKVQHMLSSQNHMLEDTIYDENVHFMVCVREEDTEHFKKEITELTNGRASSSVVDNKYVDL